MDNFDSLLENSDMLSTVMDSTLGDTVTLYYPHQVGASATVTTTAPSPAAMYQSPLPLPPPSQQQQQQQQQYNPPSVGVQLLSHTLKQDQILTTMLHEIRNLQKQVGKMCEKNNVETVTVEAETKKLKTVHVPVVLDIETRPVKVQAKPTTMITSDVRVSSSPAPAAKQHHNHYGQGNFGKKLDKIKPTETAPPSKKKRRD